MFIRYTLNHHNHCTNLITETQQNWETLDHICQQITRLHVSKIIIKLLGKTIPWNFNTTKKMLVLFYSQWPPNSNPNLNFVHIIKPPNQKRSKYIIIFTFIRFIIVIYIDSTQNQKLTQKSIKLKIKISCSQNIYC